jgi:hypothetical protein
MFVAKSGGELQAVLQQTHLILDEERMAALGHIEQQRCRQPSRGMND